MSGLRLASLLPFLLAPLENLAVGGKPLSGEARVGGESVYVSYGSETGEDVFVPHLTAVRGTWTTSLLGYLPAAKGRGGFVYDGEWNLSQSRRFIWSKALSSDVGLTYYRYLGAPEHRNSLENAFSVAAELPWNPRFSARYDYILKDFTGELTLVVERKLGGPLLLSSILCLGLRAPVGNRCWFYWALQDDLCLHITDDSDLRFGVHAAGNGDREAAGNGTLFWFGVGVGYVL